MNLHPYYQGPFYNRIDKGLAVAYVVSGFVTSASDYLTFTLFFSIVPLGLLQATVIAYIVGLVVSYVQNRYWVFRKGASRQNEATNLWRYAAFLILNLGITYVMLWALERYFGLTPYLGKFVVGFFMFFWIYMGNTYFVFRGPKMGPIQL
jgi:putative flippase GtrA